MFIGNKSYRSIFEDRLVDENLLHIFFNFLVIEN